MNKEKYHIPPLDDQTIQNEVRMIVANGVQRKESFTSFMMNLYQEIGLRYLFMNRRDGIMISLSSMVLVTILFLLITDSTSVKEEQIYALVFLISPLLYMALTVYDLLYKKYHGTYEVEMVAKYNIYQLAAFRMLHFSILSIVLNTVSIAFFVWMDDRIEFFRAFMISTTALFLFSIIFLMLFIRGRSGFAAIQIGIGWIVVNAVVYYLYDEAYKGFLTTAPIIVYAVVLFISFYVYILYLSRLIRMKSAGGVI